MAILTNEVNCLRIAASSKVEACNGGLFISPAQGTHHGRIIDSFELILVRIGRLILSEAEHVFALESGDTLILWPGRFHRGVHHTTLTPRSIGCISGLISRPGNPSE